MKYFPIFVPIEGKKCLVVGGGKVAERKIKTMKKFGAKIKVIAPKIRESIKKMAEYEEREYIEGDEEGFFIVVECTGKEDVAKKISEKCKEKNILFNSADKPELSSFIFGSIVKHGDIVLGISTSGKVPGFSKALRIELQKILKNREIKKFFREIEILRKKIKGEKGYKKIISKMSKKAIKKIF